MCSILKSMKKAYLARFNMKPLTRRISCILLGSLGLILTALLLSGHYGLFSVLLVLIALIYLAFELACKRLEEINVKNIFNAFSDLDCCSDKDIRQKMTYSQFENEEISEPMETLQTAEGEILCGENEKEQRV